MTPNGNKILMVGLITKCAILTELLPSPVVRYLSQESLKSEDTLFFTQLTAIPQEVDLSLDKLSIQKSSKLKTATFISEDSAA